MPDFYEGAGTVEDGLEAVVADGHFRAWEEGHDGALADSGVADDDNGLAAVGVLGDAGDAVLDHLAQLEEVEGVFHLI